MSFIAIDMINILILFILASCGSYTDPDQEKITYYLCENNHEIVLKRSDDYESVMIRYNKDQQVLLHHFVTTTLTGHHTEKLLWLTQGTKGVLIEKMADGTEKALFKECVAQKTKLKY